MKQKGFSLPLILLLAALLIFGGVHYFRAKYNLKSSPSATVPPASLESTQPSSSFSPSPEPKNLLHFNSVHVGNSILGFTVKSIKPFNKDLEMSSKNFIVEFSGNATLSGKYTIDDTKSFYTNTVVLFDPDTISSTKLPYAYSPHIEFKNTDKAVELLSPYGKSGNINLEIENYSSFLLDQSSFGGGSADLVRVVK